MPPVHGFQGDSLEQVRDKEISQSKDPNAGPTPLALPLTSVALNRLAVVWTTSAERTVPCWRTAEMLGNLMGVILLDAVSWLG